MAAGGPVDAERELQLGARDEAEGAFSRALAHYQACLEAAPWARVAHGARGRIAWIEERSEGDYRPLAMLVRLRHNPSALGDPTSLAQLAAETESFPAGLVRSELRLRMAEAWLKLDGHGAEASVELRRVVADPSSGGPDRKTAERDLVQALVADGRLDAARDEARAHPFDLQSATDVDRLLRQRFWKRLSVAGDLLLVLLAVVIGFVVRRRRLVRSKRPPTTPSRLPPISA